MRDQPRQFEGYTLHYDDRYFNERGRTVYSIDFTTPGGKDFRAETVVYESKTEQWIQHPHVENFVDEDIYVAVYPSAMMDGGGQSNTAPGELMLRRGQTAQLDDGAYTVEFVRYDLEPAVDGVEVDSLDLTVGAELRVTETATGETRTVAPVYLILKDRTQQYVQNRIPEWDLGFTFTGMQVEDDAVRLVVEGADTPSEDWIVVQAYRKPFINLLWLGTIVLAVGFIFSIVRRVKEQRER
jgi:cytochrome c-type biogenesis protein CcmF